MVKKLKFTLIRNLRPLGTELSDNMWILVNIGFGFKKFAGCLIVAARERKGDCKMRSH